MSNNASNKFITDSPKTNFFLGAIVGVAVMAVVGFGIMAGNLNNNGQDDQDGSVAGDEQQADGGAVNLVINDNDHVLGNPDAPVKIFEFSDFQCPYCSRHHVTMHNIVDEYGDQVAWVYKHFPLSSHPLAMPGAHASECAGEQDKFWEMSDKIFEGQSDLTNASFETFANQLGLNMDQYKSCVDDEKYKDKILADYNLGIDSGVNGTPSNFINNQNVAGAVPFATMQQAIDSFLQ